MSITKAEEIIKNFYTYFNNCELDKLFSLIDENVVFEINYIKSSGLVTYKEYISTSKKHYDERIDDYLFMVSPDGKSVTTKFIVKGKYIATDQSAIPATGQSYQLAVVNYFEIEDDKITKGGCWFDDNAWIEQVA